MDMQADKSFNQALQEFERRLETPVVPGELAQWIREVVQACDRVGTESDRQRRETHARLLDRIAREDDGLLQRVELLRQEDELIRVDYEQLRVQSQQLGQQVDAAEPDERRLDDLVEAFTRRGLDFVIRARSQEVAMETWFMESLDRDRGVVD